MAKAPTSAVSRSVAVEPWVREAWSTAASSVAASRWNTAASRSSWLPNCRSTAPDAMPVSSAILRVVAATNPPSAMREDAASRMSVREFRSGWWAREERRAVRDVGRETAGRVVVKGAGSLGECPWASELPTVVLPTVVEWVSEAVIMVEPSVVGCVVSGDSPSGRRLRTVL